MNRLAMGGLACGLALLAVACASGGFSTDGPFNGIGSTISETVCDWTPPGGVVYDGVEAFSNTGGTAKLERAALVQSRNLRLVAAWVVPKGNAPLIGAGQGYPTASGLAAESPRFQWARRQRILGAVVGPTHRRDLFNLVLVVKPSGKVGTAKGIDLYYEAGGVHYLLRWQHGLKIWVGHSRC